ncbi:GNAT family N-acetyltransferase [Nostoc sp. WHI]|uniref:GNAT family N-acetyltransferase n=1 Tax=Nostoc sp. WHI TaxID=2650611 RepID=UPI0018C799E3|nr:GNAT family protein [Nostoc sp. WHI]MBG1269928.1 GNAT family N-acetyltransferase [Nostoc sp. WHI]
MTLILETQRLVLKPILKSGLNTLHAILIDSYVRKYLCDDKIFLLEQVEEMVSLSQNNFEEKRLGLWFIETKNEQEITGFVGLWDFFDEEQPQLVVIDHGAIANYKKVKPIDIKELEFKRSRQQTDSIWEIKLYKFVGFKQHF